MRTVYGISSSRLFESYWDADHTLPVCEGGGLAGLDNIRTLCLGCHRTATRELAARRAVRNRKTKDQPADSGPQSSSGRRRSGR
jgi:5-methylcytosine-specific restriction protein A